MSFLRFIILAFFIIISFIPQVSHAKKKRLPAPQGEAAELNYCIQLSQKKKMEETVNCLEAFKSRHPNSEKASEADLIIADNYFKKKDYLMAAETYQDFIKENPYHSKVDYAYYKSGVSYLKEAPKTVGRDQKYLDLSVKNFELLIRYFPNSTYNKLAEKLYVAGRSKEAKKQFNIARFYYRYSQYKACLPRFTEVLTHYSQLGYDEKSFYYLINAYKKLKNPEAVKEAIALFEEKHPQSKWLKKVK